MGFGRTDSLVVRASLHTHLSQYGSTFWRTHEPHNCLGLIQPISREANGFPAWFLANRKDTTSGRSSSAASVVVGSSMYQLYVEPIGYQWFILATLTLISGSATVRLPSSYASISISETFVFTAVLLYGPAAGTLIVALDGLVISFWISRRNPESPSSSVQHVGASRLGVVLGPPLLPSCSTLTR